MDAMIHVQKRSESSTSIARVAIRNNAYTWRPYDAHYTQSMENIRVSLLSISLMRPSSSTTSKLLNVRVYMQIKHNISL